MLSICLLFMHLQYLDQGIQWQVPFSIELTALSQSGASVFLSNHVLYIYTPTGSMVNEFPIDGEVEHLWMDKEHQIWVVFEEELKVYTVSGVEIAAVPIPITIAGPISLKSSIGLVSTNGLTLYTIQTGNFPGKFGKRLRTVELSFENTFSANPAENRIFLCDRNGKMVLWYPFDNISYPFANKRSGLVTFFSESPRGSLALVFKNRTLLVRSKSAKQKMSQKTTGELSEYAAPNHEYEKSWERSYSLDIRQKPVWLSFEQRECLVFLSEDRVMRVYREDGLELTRKLISHRPNSLIQLDKTRCLARFEQSKELVFYDFKTNTFDIENMEDTVIELIKNGNFLLLVNREGHIKMRRIRQNDE